ncbi:MAG: ATP-dependent DNA helicase [Clostridiales bacterium]|nr:ATP-dependent DNA helicase [Clostridiales bacterium]
MDDIIKLSVREVTDFLCRSGSLDSRAGIARMVEGTRMHNILQSRDANKYGGAYVKEVALSWVFTLGSECDIYNNEGNCEVLPLRIELSGRADGIIDDDDGYTIDEIKTTTMPLRFINEEDFPAYRAQLDCYACMFALLHGLDHVRTRLTFCHIETEDCIYFYHERTRDELLAVVMGLLDEYRKWTRLRAYFTAELASSAAKLKFPFRSFREGQSDMVLTAYQVFKRGGRLYVQAPTGIGKTISAIYPAYKALGDGFGKRIFYLTAKTPLRTAAQNAVKLLRRSGLHTRSIILTAKEKCCLCREAVRDCSDLVCEYSEGHLDRVNAALWQLLNAYDDFTPSLIEKSAKEFKVCPYELSLDLALWCDIIICDYNYLFDPRVSLKRFFGSFDDDSDCTPEENIFLIDEAHNLADRARETYSAELRFSPFLDMLKRIPESDFILYQPLRALCRQFLRLKRRAKANMETNGTFLLSHDPFESFGDAVTIFIDSALEWLHVNGSLSVKDSPLPSPDKLSDLRFDAMRFKFALERFGKSFINYVELSGDEIRVKILCRDPSAIVAKRLDRGRAAMLFSATFTPLDYYANLLGGMNEGSGSFSYGSKKGSKIRLLELESPFPRENLLVAAMYKISTRFGDRDATIHAAAEVLAATVGAKAGNYIAYFPSYRLMRETYNAFRLVDSDTYCIMQKPDMTESDRDAFIKKFDTNEKGMLAFAVLGGIFSEGIDLIGDRLIGSIIVGVGLAQLNNESNIIAEYYNEVNEQGYEYAYVYPGMNKVLQAAGRVIRTDTDRGVVVLIDDRFATPTYTNLYPSHWKGMKLVGDTHALRKVLADFWNDI